MKFDNIDNRNSFDFGKTSEAYAKYRDIYPKKLYERPQAEASRRRRHMS